MKTVPKNGDLNDSHQSPKPEDEKFVERTII